MRFFEVKIDLRICTLTVTILALSLLPFTPPANAASDQANRYVEDARRYLGKGDIRAAVIQLRNAVRVDPDDPELRLQLAEVYLRLDDGPSAEKEFKAGRERGAPEVDLAVGLARAYLVQGKAREIIKEFPAGDRGSVIESGLAVNRGFALLLLKRPVEAEVEFKEAARQRPQDPLALVGLSQIRILERNISEAEALTDHALALEPNLADALSLKSEFRRQSGDIENAIHYANKAIDSNPNAVVPRLARSRGLIDRGEFAVAYGDVRTALEIAPQHVGAQYLAAVILTHQNKRTEALEILQKIGASSDAAPPVLLLLGALQFQGNQPEHATTSLSRYMAATGGDMRSRKLLAMVHLGRYVPKRAIEILLPIAESAGDDPQFYGLLATAYMRDRQPVEASRWLDRAAQISTLDPAARIQVAVGQLRAGQPEAAEKELERALAIDPASNEARILLALAQIQSGDFENAARTAHELLVQSPSNVVALNLSGSIEALRQNYPAAQAQFQKALMQQPDFIPARVNLGRLEAAQGNVEKAREHFDSVLRQDRRHLESLLAVADLLRRSNKHEDAAQLLERAAIENPRALAPRGRLVEYYLGRRETMKALAWARQMYEIDANSPPSIYALARSQLAARDAGNAVTNARRLVAILPNSAVAYRQLAQTLAALNDADGAHKALKRAVQIDETYLPALTDLVEAELQAGRTDTAARLAEDWQAKHQGQAAGNMLVGDVALRTGRYADAIRAYEAAFKKEANSTNVIRLHEARMRAGNREAAIAEIQNWLAANPSDLSARASLGNTYISIGQFDEAVRVYEQVVRQSPDNAFALNNLAWLYDRMSDPRAVTFSERAYRIAPDQPAIADTYGYVLLRRGEVERALNLLQEAHARAPSSGEIGYHLAIALNASKRPTEAIVVLEKVLQLDRNFEKADEAVRLLHTLQGN